MGRTIRHVDSGLHYTHVVRDCPAYKDVVQCLKRLAAQHSWNSVVSFDQLDVIKGSSAFQDEHRMFILWGTIEHAGPAISANRRCKLAIQYLETIGNPEWLSPNQRAVLGPFLDRARQFDLVFAQTPEAVEWLQNRVGAKARLAPVGYDPQVMGRPDFEAEKTGDLAFYGAVMQRREILRHLQPYLRHELSDISGVYGMQRQHRLNESRAILQVHHTRADCSFASFRIWQAIGTSAVLLMEPIDAWPAVPGRHYLEFPPLSTDNLMEAAGAIDAILDRSDLLDVARLAHEELSVYTPAFCMERFVVPASAELNS